MVLSTRFPDKNMFASGCCTGCSHLHENKKQPASNEGGWVLRSGRGQLRETGSTSTAPPAVTIRSTFSRQHRPKHFSIFQRDIHLIEYKYCEDTRPLNQLNAMQEEHKGLCIILEGAWSPLLPSTPSTRTVAPSTTETFKVYKVCKKRLQSRSATASLFIKSD